MLKNRLFRTGLGWISLACLLLTACEQEHFFQGYVEGRYTYISSHVSGRLKKLLVARGDYVTPGQLLFKLEVEPESSQLKEAQASVLQAQDQLVSAEEGLQLAEITLKRQETLEKKSAIDIQTVDQTRTQRNQAQASKNQAANHLQSLEASLKKAQWYYHEKNIQSPKEAFVFDTLYLQGELIPSHTPVLSLISKKDLYVVFYVKGTALSRFKIHQGVKIIQSGKKTPIPAKITYISPTAEYTPPVIYSNETNAKLVFRMEATPVSPVYDLHPGAPVEIKK